MERDLSRIRQRRAERERLSAPTKPISPTKQSQVAVETDQNSPTAEDSQKLSAKEGEKARLDKDVVMSDPVNPQNTQSSVTLGSDDALKADEKGQAITSLKGMPQDSQNTAGLAISMPNDPPFKEADLPNDNGGNSHNLDMNANLVGTVNTSSDQVKNVDDFDFASMFDDPNLMPQSGTMDLDFDFSNNNTGTQNLLGDGSLDSMVLSNEDLSKAVPATNEDLDSLLPGLDNYVNASGDTAANKEPTITNPRAFDDAQASQDPSMKNTAVTALGEQPLENFDDFFNPADFNIGGGTDSNNNNHNNSNTNNKNNNHNNNNPLGDSQLGGFEEFDEDWFTNM